MARRKQYVIQGGKQDVKKDMKAVVCTIRIPVFDFKKVHLFEKGIKICQVAGATGHKVAWEKSRVPRRRQIKFTGH